MYRNCKNTISETNCDHFESATVVIRGQTRTPDIHTKKTSGSGVTPAREQLHGSKGFLTPNKVHKKSREGELDTKTEPKL